MGLTSWEDLLPEIAESFGGQMPYPETAEDIQAAYQRAPQTVMRMADAVAALYADGSAQNPWGMLRYRVKQIPDTDPGKPSKGTNREKAIERAEQRIRNELLHYDRWDEVEDELFGDRGTLREWPDLQPRMHQHWQQLRPLGVATELESLERSRIRRERLAELAKAPHKTQTTQAAKPGNLEIKDGITVETT